MIDNRIEFIDSDYHFSAKQRFNDAQSLDCSFAVRCYLFGVVIESILKAGAYAFNGKHDLVKLLQDSNIETYTTFEQRNEIIAIIKTVRIIWDNNLRWADDKRINRAIASYNMQFPKKAEYNFEKVKINMQNCLKEAAAILLEAKKL